VILLLKRIEYLIVRSIDWPVLIYFLANMHGF
jgi:hypothetical protein